MPCFRGFLKFRVFVQVCIILQVLLAFGLSLADPIATDAPHHKAGYLEQLKAIENYVTESEREIKDLGSSDPKRAANERGALMGGFQMLAAARALVGDTQGAIASFDQSQRMWEEAHGVEKIGDERADLLAIDGAHLEDAVEAIARAARSRQIVILNEAHHVPYDRILAMRLARALKKEGYEYLACETFRVNDQHVLNRGYVTQRTGVYSRESTFAKFLADAKIDGWKFVSYEPSGGPREYLMAKNIVDRILVSDPKAKIFVYAGYSHAMKVPVSESDDDKSKFAAQLRRITGIDPLTINQTTLFAHYGSAQQARYYRHAVKKVSVNEAAVLMDARGVPIRLGIDRNAYDFEVVHPRYAQDPRTHRPTWLTKEFKAVDVPSDMIPTKGRRAIYAYLRGAESDAVPLDVVILKPDAPVPKLMLPEGDYVYEYED